MKNGDFLPEIRRGRFDQLTIYEVSEGELKILERGAPDSVYLNFSIALFSEAIAFTVSLITTEIVSGRVFTTFIILAVAGYVIGAVLGALWYRNRTSVSDCVQTVRGRLPPEGVRQASDTEE
jgi:NADH:ubiquinone oxidoreductase subunit K